MQTAIERDLKEMCQIRKYIPNDMLEAYLEYASLYSKKYWLLFQDEFLLRMEFEIALL
jgi:hypothetical protein